MSDNLYRFPVSAQLPAPKAPMTFPVVGLAVFAVLCAGLAAVVDKPGLPLVLVLAGAWFGLLAFALARLMKSVAHRVVRVDAADGDLRFVPGRGHVALQFAVPGGLLAIWLVLLALLRGPDAAETFSALPMRSALVALPVVILYQIWTMRSAGGLKLTPTGVSGVRFATRISISWDEFLDVHIQELPGRGKLSIIPRGGRALTVDAAHTGSDAQAVAVVLRHFAQHPEDRERLSEGAAALELFDVVPVPGKPG